MSFFQPNGKSSRTKTAQSLEAWAADAEHAAEGLKKAAECYRTGNIEDGRMYAHVAIGVFKMILGVYSSKQGKQDMRI